MATTRGPADTRSHDVVVCLAGPTAELHDYLTGSEGSFRGAVVHLRRARGGKARTGVRHEITRASYRHLTEVVRLAHGLGASAVELTFARAADRPVSSSRPPEELMIPHLRRALETARALGLRYVVRPHRSDEEVSHWFADAASERPRGNQ